MKTKFLIGCLVLVLSSCLIITVVIGIIFFSTNVIASDITLGSGETVEGNLVLPGFNGTIDDGARVTGSLVCLGSNVAIAGKVDGSLIAFGCNVSVDRSGDVGGRIYSFGSLVSR